MAGYCLPTAISPDNSAYESWDSHLRGFNQNVFEARLPIGDKQRKSACLQIIHPGAHSDLVVDVHHADSLIDHELQRIVLIGLERQRALQLYFIGQDLPAMFVRKDIGLEHHPAAIRLELDMISFVQFLCSP